MTREYGRWCDTGLKDMRGRIIQVGDDVAKAVSGGRAVNMSICRVTRIEDGKLYLNDSHVAVHYPGRLLVVVHAKVKAIADLIETTIETKARYMAHLRTPNDATAIAYLQVNIEELQRILDDLKETY